MLRINFAYNTSLILLEQQFKCSTFTCNVAFFFIVLLLPLLKAALIDTSTITVDLMTVSHVKGVSRRDEKDHLTPRVLPALEAF